jgi:hypothetical protein
VTTISSPKRLHDDLDAAVRFCPERLVQFRPFLQRGAVRDNEGGINLPFSIRSINFGM